MGAERRVGRERVLLPVLIRLPYVELLRKLFVFDQVRHLKELTIEVNFQQCQCGFFDRLLAVHHEFKVAFLDVVGLDSLPYLGDVLDLVTLVEIQKLYHEVHDGFRLDAALVEVAFL